MDLFNPFHPETAAIIVDAMKQAEAVWGEAKTDWSGVSFSCGHSGRYGQVVAYCMRNTGVISFVIDNGFSMLTSTPEGMKHKNANAFRGVVLHELGHRVQFHSKNAPWGKDNKAPVHMNKSWQWVCRTGWTALSDATVTERNMRVAMRINADAAHSMMQHFDPQRAPSFFTRKGQLAILKRMREARKTTCACCETVFMQSRRGRKAKFCSNACKAAHHRAAKAPASKEVLAA